MSNGHANAGCLNFVRKNEVQQVPLEEHGAIIYDLDIFEKHLILYQRIGGLPRISVLDLPLSINLVSVILSCKSFPKVMLILIET